MAGEKSGFRTRIFRAVHAEAPKRGLDHDGLHDLVVKTYPGVHSMSQLTDAQLLGIYRGWTGKTLKRRTKLPRREETNAGAEMVAAEDLIVLDQEFAKRNLDADGRRNFISRQLQGRAEIRTRRDFGRVLGGLRAMNKRDQL